MYNLLEDFLEDGNNWWNWNGPLTRQIYAATTSFLAKLLGQASLPNYAILVSRISVGLGGLGSLNSRYCAAPDFTITVTATMRIANDGISLNPNLGPY